MVAVGLVFVFAVLVVAAPTSVDLGFVVAVLGFFVLVSLYPPVQGVGRVPALLSTNLLIFN